MAVHELVASPLGKGLFARAIGESGLPDPGDAPPLAEAEAAGVAFAKDKGATTIAELRAMPPEVLAASKGSKQVRFVPVLDGVVLPSLNPASRVPTLLGYTADEGSALGSNYGSPEPEMLQRLIADHYGRSAAHFASFYPASTAEQRAESNCQVRRDSGAGDIYDWAVRRGGMPAIYAYQWTHTEPGPQSNRWRAFHSSEIPYVFQTLGASPERQFTAVDQALSQRISSYWLNFVRSGDPNGGGLPRWPKFELRSPQILSIGDRIVSRPLLPPDKMAAMRAFIAGGGQPSIF
jgi:para-nitrobenzyl esterase